MNIIFEQPGTSFTGGIFTTDVDRSGKAFLFKLRWAAGSGPVMDVANAQLKQYLPNINVTAYVTTKDSKQTKICTSFPLAALFEYAAQNEGSIRVVTNPATPLEVLEVWGRFEICPEGGLYLGNDEQIRLELESLPTAATFFMSIYFLDSALLDYEVLQYDQWSVASNVKERSFAIDGHDTLLFPVTGGVFKDVLLGFTNGKNVRLQEDELRFIALDTNDFATTGGSLTPGYSSHYVINVEEAVQADVTTSGAGYTFYAVSTEPVTKPSNVQEKNQALTNASDAQKIRAAAVIENK